MLSPVLFSSENTNHRTPTWLFRKLNDEFHFQLDAAASQYNALCEKYYSVGDDGLAQPWAPLVTWLNPPYSRKLIRWLRKSREEAVAGTTVVVLVPARTDTEWFHRYAFGYAQIRFVRGRMTFGNEQNGAPFPSMVLIFRDRSVVDLGLPALGETIDARDTDIAVEEKGIVSERVEGVPYLPDMRMSVRVTDAPLARGSTLRDGSPSRGFVRKPL